MSERPNGLGEIIQWPGGYAMTLGYARNNTIRCCAGHERPSDAKHHGLVRLMELVPVVADHDIAEWAAKAEVVPS